jgi:hypothetical protein
MGKRLCVARILLRIHLSARSEMLVAGDCLPSGACEPHAYTEANATLGFTQ